MRPVASLFMACLALTHMVGCASMLTRERVTAQYVDQLVAVEEYGVALDILHGVPETHPQYAALHKKLQQVTARAANYERMMLNHAEEKREEGNWSDAFRVLDIGLDKFPSSVVLKRGWEELLRKQAQRMQELEAEILIAKGRWLAEEVPLREELARVAPKDLRATWKLWSIRNARHRTAQELFNCGKQAMSGDNLELAMNCLTLAERLDPSPIITWEVAKLRREIAEREEETQREIRRAEEEKLRQEARRLARLAEQAMERGEFQTAREILSELVEIDADNPEVRKLQQQLNKTVSTRVATMLERGTMLYREGKIEEAKEMWEEVLQLDPSHGQAQARVERANRILEKLRRLRERDAPTE